MQRPDLAAVLRPLKGFQRATVDHAFEQLFLREDSTHRFLVADEVGLGKTLVARGIIARAVDHLWDDVPSLNVLYMCSNGSIARQNLAKLQLAGAGGESLALATRLTLLATRLGGAGTGGLAQSKLNFVSFTPRTSFEMGHSTGVSDERVVLFHLLAPLFEHWKPLANVLQGNVQNADAWRRRLLAWEGTVDEAVATRFCAAWAADDGLRDRMAHLCAGAFARKRAHRPEADRGPRNAVIGELRRLLACACVDRLEPDLIVRDEFQRFKGLLEPRPDRQDAAAALAQQLFDAVTPEGRPVRTLLLSATPYKLYTADAEIQDEDHYQDFLETTRFLMGNDEGRVGALRRDLSRFGAALKRASTGHVDEVAPAKRAVEGALRRVMARTERVGDSEARDAMVSEPAVPMSMRSADVRQYLAAHALFRAVGARDPMAFWKSAPYLPHFMRGYQFNRRFQAACDNEPDDVVPVLRSHRAAWLSREGVVAFDEVAASHAKVRALVEELVEPGLWRLLWMPPTVPYWPLEGAFAGQEAQTKALVFSAWNVVPDVVAALLSYEVERRMWGPELPTYTEVTHTPLLRLSEGKEGRRSAHRNLLTLLPCLPLADEAHPLRAPDGTDRQAFVRARVRRLLARLPAPRGERQDDRWEYALPLLLDTDLRPFLEAWRDDTERRRPSPALFDAYVDDLLQLSVDELGPRPEGLEDLAVDLALGSPAILAARTLGSVGLSNQERREHAATVAHTSWSLFNQPAVTALLRRLHPELPYWRVVLHYSRDGNLQAVLDEQWHLLWEQHAWADALDRGEVAAECVEALAGQVSPQRSFVVPSFHQVTPEGGVTTSSLQLRTTFAQRFGEARADDGRAVSQDAVRAAFNSPFRPFVLVSTSVGQEGLDFHTWCHRLVHWNLPGNPVDLEQREGRVHRYKGHAVRRNVAHGFADGALGCWQVGDDLWGRLFEAADEAARAQEQSELVPFWIAPGPHKVWRHVPMLPFTREVEAFARLKRQLAAYRVVFGQPRQEELLRLLDGAAIDVETLRDWIIDLRPRPPSL